MKIKFILTLSIILQSQIIFSQFNADSLFIVARDLAFKGKYQDSRLLGKKILDEFPNYIDAQLLIARTFAWEEKYDSSKFILDEILTKDSANYDALGIYINVENWSENYNSALNWCNKALSYYPDDINLKLQKAKILKNLKQYDAAIEIVEAILTQEPENEEAKILLLQLKLLLAKNEIAFGYAINIFQNSDLAPWHLAFLEYTRKTELGPIIGRINLGNRFGIYGWQYELDAYPKITKKSYLYLNAGFSQSKIFPIWRFGAEFYHSLPKDFEIGLGFRQLIFETTKVTILTQYIGKYFGSFWFSIHSYITPINNKITVSEIFLMRKYFGNPQNYLGFLIGYGVSPDDRINLSADRNDPNLSSYSFKINFNHTYKNFWILNFGIGFTKDEYLSESYRNIYTFETKISRIF